MSIFFNLLIAAIVITGTVTFTIGVQELADRRKQEKKAKQEQRKQEEELALKAMAKDIATELYEKIKQGE